MKKYLILAVTLMMLSCAAACGTKPESAPAETVPETTVSAEETEAAADTVGGAYLAAFLTTQATTPSAIVEELIGKGILETEMVSMDVEPGYLDGFSEEITGFTSGVKFSPMIGAIPFVGYVLETEDPEALIEEMKSKADMAWNVCTEADEMVYMAGDCKVFFLMCSNEE